MSLTDYSLMVQPENNLPEVTMDIVDTLRAIDGSGNSVELPKENAQFAGTQISVSVAGVSATNVNTAIAELKANEDTLGSTKAPINNPTFTGNVVVPTADSANEAVNKGQMDTADALKLDKSAVVDVLGTSTANVINQLLLTQIFKDTLNQTLLTVDDIADGVRTSTVTAVMPLLALEYGKKYTISAKSTASLTGGLTFYKVVPSSIIIQNFPAGSDFVNGVSFDYIPDTDLVLNWRVYAIGLAVTFNITHEEYISEDINNSVALKSKSDGFLETSEIASLLNYTTLSTSVFSPTSVGVIQGSVLQVLFKAQYKGDFAIYAYRANATNYIIKQYTDNDYSVEKSYFFAVPSDCVTIQIRTWKTGVVIDYYKLIKSDIRLTYLPKNAGLWAKKVGALYGDSITSLTDGDFVQPFTAFTKWAQYIGHYMGLSSIYGRGIGSQTYKYTTILADDNRIGGSVSWVTPTGILIDRLNTYDKDKWDALEVKVYPAGVTAEMVAAGTAITTRGSLSSWHRIISMFPASIKDTINFVMVMGATNDAIDSTALAWVASDTTDAEWAASTQYATYGGDYNLTTLKGGIASTIMKMQAWMPNTVIIIATPLSGRGTTGQLNPSGINLDEYQKSVFVREVANRLSIPIIDMNSECGINGLNRTTYITDGVHPATTAGYKMMARVVIGNLSKILPNL